MGSGLFENDLPTDHEPGRIPGGETPPSTAGGTPVATNARFMGSRVGESAMLTGLEPGEVEGRLRRRLRSVVSGLTLGDLHGIAVNIGQK